MLKQMSYILLIPSILLSSDLEDVINSTMKNENSMNYSIEIDKAKLDKKINMSNYSLNVDLNGNLNKAIGGISNSDIDRSSQINIKASYLLYDGGKKKLTNDISNENIKLSVNSKTLFENDTLYNLFSLFLNGKKFENNIKTLEKKKITLVTEVNRLKSLFEASLITEDEYLRVKADLYSIDSDILSLEQNIKVLKNDVYILSGIKIMNFKEILSFSVTNFNPDSLYFNNFDLISSIYNKNSKLYKLNYMPTVFIEGNSYYNNSVMGNNFNNDGFNHNLTIGFKWKLYDGNKNNLNYVKVQKDRIANNNKRDYALRTKISQFNNINSEITVIQNKIISMKARKEFLLRTFESIKNKFENNLVDNVNYLDAFANYYDSISLLNNLYIDLDIKKLDLLYVSGNLIKNNYEIK